MNANVKHHHHGIVIGIWTVNEIVNGIVMIYDHGVVDYHVVVVFVN